MKKVAIYVASFTLLLPYSVVLAGPIVRSGESVTVDANQSLTGDFYGLATEVTISGSSDNDVHVAGLRVTINGPVKGDVTIVGGTVQVHGEVDDDLRVIGADVVLGTPVKGDVVVYGGNLTILSTASVGGDVLFWGNNLTIDGPVAGSIHGSSDSVRINAAISGGIDFMAHKALVLSDNAKITGDIVYRGFANIIRAQNAVVEGNVQYIKASSEDTQSVMRVFIFVLIGILFSVFTLYFFARGFVERMVAKSESHLGLYGLVGIAGLLALPLVSVLLMVSVVGMMIGVLLFTGYFALLMLSAIMSVILLGHGVQRILFKQETFAIYTPLLGSVLVVIITLIPFGSFILLGVIIVSLGVLIHALYHTIRA